MMISAKPFLASSATIYGANDALLPVEAFSRCDVVAVP